jgi:DNA repair exonuclease SbcCD ATPase subunit
MDVSSVLITMKIISLTSENIKRLKAVDITPNGVSLEVAGRNAQGKSSVLDSIVYALAGKGALCERPIRDGESRAEICVDLGDYTVTRTITAGGGGQLKVVPKDGKQGLLQPQSILDKIIGTLTFDPLDFSRQKDTEQADCLRKLVGLDFTDLEQLHAKLYDERLHLGREVIVLQGKIANCVTYANVPATEVSIADALKAKTYAENHNRRNQEQRHRITILAAERINSAAAVKYFQNLVEGLDRQLQQARNEFESALGAQRRANADYHEHLSIVEKLNDADTNEFDKQILDAEQTNMCVKANRELAAQNAELAVKDTRYAEYNTEIEDIEIERQRRLAAVHFPLPGLSFSRDGKVVFNGVPFSQISSAEQLKVSASIALALNPQLRVMLIRDGSLLDADSLEVLKSLASERDAQLWIERVGGLTGSLPGIVIEDGEVTKSTLDV